MGRMGALFSHRRDLRDADGSGRQGTSLLRIIADGGSSACGSSACGSKTGAKPEEEDGARPSVWLRSPRRVKNCGLKARRNRLAYREAENESLRFADLELAPAACPPAAGTAPLARRLLAREPVEAACRRMFGLACKRRVGLHSALPARGGGHGVPG